MTNFEMPSINGQSKDGDMPHTSTVRNGRFSGAQTAPPVQINVTGWKMFNLACSIGLVLLYGNWVVLPAKESDVKLMQTELVGVKAALSTISLDLRDIRSDMQRTREALIGFGAAVDPQAKVAPVRRVKPRVHEQTEAGAVRR